MNDSIADTLGVEPIEYEAIEPANTEAETRSAEEFNEIVTEFRRKALDHATLDLKDSRDNIRSLIEVGMDILLDAGAAVKESQSDKAISAASYLIKTIGDLNAQLVKMNFDALKQTQALQPKPEEAAPAQTVQNNIIVADVNDIFSEIVPVERTFESEIEEAKEE